MAWVADAPARIMPVMAPGRATRPTTLVWSIVGSIPVRMADRCQGAAAWWLVWPRDRRASTSRRCAARSSRRRTMTRDVVFMALAMIIDPRGMMARALVGTMPRTARTPGVPAAANEIAAAAIVYAPGTRRPRRPEVNVAVPTITARTRRVRAPWPRKT